MLAPRPAPVDLQRLTSDVAPLLGRTRGPGTGVPPSARCRGTGASNGPTSTVRWGKTSDSNQVFDRA